ncbi:O-antigen translocase [Flavobacterium sp. NRK1]|uniref:O-antigen translocase n=1 Tax=Flavobacterium sp. NRK1 TaxID=2954929 RepID=UPI00209227A7|nr:O-antigen translocase [Flavobacterium sp. NRK1]MCO6148638.1 O-antigen translocase [Flavobacterium sp. NRK1]
MRILSKIIKKPIVKIFSLNGISVIVRILGGLMTSKAIASYIGASGLAVLGNFRNFITTLDAYSTLGMQNGIIKYTAENQKKEEQLYTILSTVFFTVLSVLLVISTLLFILSGYLSQLVFNSYKDYSWLFKVVAFSLPWYTGSLICMWVLNGLGEYKKVIWLNISGNVVGVLLSILLMWKFRTNGALIGLILFQALFFIFSFYNLWQHFPFFPFLKLKYFNFKVLSRLLSFSLMTLTTAFISPFIYHSIRNNLMINYSPDTAGHWEAINRLASFYLMFASTMLSIYFLPKLSLAQTTEETKRIFGNYYKSMLPLFGLGLTILYFIREFVVLFIFKRSFLPMTELFLWQLLGDFFKVGSLILGYQFFAKKLTKAFVVTEVISSIFLYLSCTFFIEDFGAKGAVMGYALTYFVYWIMLAIYFRKQLF